MKGELVFTNFEITTPRAREIVSILSKAQDMASGLYESYVKELSNLCRRRTFQVNNLVVLSGRSVLARILAGDTTYSGEINYGALGTGSTAVDAADTVLDTEVARKLHARRVRTNHSVAFDFFYSQADTDGTYEEFGMFIDGTSSVDTGVLFNRALTGGWTKSDTEAMTVSVTISVNP